MIKINSDKPYRIFAKEMDQAALDQFESALNQFYAVKGALMPDGHKGYSLPIGGVVATKDYLVPAWVGYDIGCGVLAYPITTKLNMLRTNAETIYKQILRDVPTGYSHNSDDIFLPELMDVAHTRVVDEVLGRYNGWHQMGSLGGGEITL